MKRSDLVGLQTGSAGISRRRFIGAGAGVALASSAVGIPSNAVGADLRRHGVRGDGASDDTEALQRALDAASGGTVELPPGRYVISGPGLVVRSGTRLIGRSRAVLVAASAGPFGLINLPPGTHGVEIAGLELLGPWAEQAFPAAHTPEERRATFAGLAENIGIHAQGVWQLREFSRMLHRGSPPPSASLDLSIQDCIVAGFGQSGVLADNVTRFAFRNNRIRRCGRDGLRMYGVEDGRVEGNLVADLLFGFPGNPPFHNVYGITATRVYGNSRVPDPDCILGRPSRRVLIAGNTVRNASSWKSLDTHGGREISFIGNTCTGSHIGIGVDKGGADAVRGYAPPLDIRIASNTLLAQPGQLASRAGIACYAHDADRRNLGRNVKIEQNTIRGYGGERTDGAISISNFESIGIRNNVIEDSLRSAVCADNEANSMEITGNQIRGVRRTSFGAAYGVLIQTAEAAGAICANLIAQPDSLPPLAAHLSFETDAVRQRFRICSDNVFTGASQAVVRAPR